MDPDKIGLICPLRAEGGSLKRLKEFGLGVCQLNNWSYSLWNQDTLRQTQAELRETGVDVCAVWAGWEGEAQWNFTQGPQTLGLVPENTRALRMKGYQQAADWASELGTQAIITHLGFIPENMNDPLWPGFVDSVIDVARHCEKRGIGFWFETGQETPVVMLRLIEESGMDNLGINLDPANLILYGKANPVDALEVFGKHVKNVHVKDGFYPTNGRELGREVAVGKGRVDFPALVAKLKALGYEGEWIIEREIPEGQEQSQDIRETVDKLRNWLR